METTNTTADAPRRTTSLPAARRRGRIFRHPTVSRNSPAYQALEWGMMQAYSNGTADPYWKAATVAHALSTAPGRTDSADWNAMESMVDRAQAFYAVGTQGMNAAGAMVSAWDGASSGDYGGPVVTPPDGGESKTVAGEPPQKDKGGEPLITPVKKPNARCCAQLFYPVPTPKEDEEPFGDGSVLWFNDFEGLAIYSNDGDCDCTCCYFRQYINTKITGGYVGAPGKPSGPGNAPLPHFKRGEDEDKDHNKFGRDGNPYNKKKTIRCRDRKKGQSCEERSDGPVSSIPSTLPEHIQRLLETHTKGMGSFCYYYMRDNPGVRVSPGEYKHRSDCFHGIVRTTCPKCAIQAEGSFSLYAGGAVSWSGQKRRSTKRNVPFILDATDKEPDDPRAVYLPNVPCNIPEAEGCE